MISSKTIERGHGRIDTRKIDTLSIGTECLKKYGSSFPHVNQIFRISRESRSLYGKMLRQEIAYGFTNAIAYTAYPDTKFGSKNHMRIVFSTIFKY